MGKSAWLWIGLFAGLLLIEPPFLYVVKAVAKSVPLLGRYGTFWIYCYAFGFLYWVALLLSALYAPGWRTPELTEDQLQKIFESAAR